MVRHGAVGGGENGGDADGILDLAGNGGFPNLPRADNDMDDRYRPGKMLEKAYLQGAFEIHNLLVSYIFKTITNFYSIIE